MTPKMLAALRDAAANDRTGGLTRTVAGWKPVDDITTNHSFQSVNALIDRSYLKKAGPRVSEYAYVTDTGFDYLSFAGFHRDGSPMQKGVRT